MDLAIAKQQFWGRHAAVPLADRQRKVLQRLLDAGDGGFLGAGAAITVLWSALAAHLMEEGYDTLIGCASISLADGGTTLASVMPTLREKHFVGDELRVSPTRQIVLSTPAAGSASVPPLLKAYLRMGCRIGGEACWDPEFNCADVFILMDVQAMAGRYAQRFLKTA